MCLWNTIAPNDQFQKLPNSRVQISWYLSEKMLMYVQDESSSIHFENRVFEK